MRKLLIGVAGSSAALALTAATMAGPPAGAAPAKPNLAKLVALKDVRRHLAAFQEIADYNGGNRAAGRPGYDVSVKYVAGRLRAAGLKPVVQKFTFPYWGERSGAALAQAAPHKASYRRGHDFLTMRYSGSGDVTGAVTAVDVPSSGEGTSGCETADYKDFARGAVALVQRGGCTFEAKAERARAAGAAALLVFNTTAEKGPINGTVERAQALPVLGVTHKLGAGLVKASKSELRLRVKTDITQGRKTTSNVIADTRQGRPGNVVLLGAHLDSVREGPGINDNGTGSAALLAIAEKISALGKAGLRNRVRFAWWGAEEEGLRGSIHYVRTLSPAARSAIALNLNFDMLGSVNGVRGVYDGDHSARSGVKAPAGSGAIERMFRWHFAGLGLPTKQSPFNGTSDYGPFIEHGIPTGGIDTGANGTKTAAEAKKFGGRAGKVYDPCYHAKCDRLKNVDLKLLDTNTDAIAAVTQHLAETTVAVNGHAQRLESAGPAPLYRGGQLIR
ncbi:M28 family peptidase [Actinomadura terrae]|uniref:M28 family peptidase n=1 Tax=Actinomadura terrae TaxID=604353 RepID=UPI001FA7AFD8|nr:M28 family peptidase [Actinomadura terrae]